GAHPFYEEDNLGYTEYAGEDHYIWTDVYGEAVMYDWLFAQNVEDPSLADGETILFDFGNTKFTGPDSLSRYWNSGSYGLFKTTGTIFPYAQTSDGNATKVCLSILGVFGNHTNSE